MEAVIKKKTQNAVGYPVLKVCSINGRISLFFDKSTCIIINEDGVRMSLRIQDDNCYFDSIFDGELRLKNDSKNDPRSVSNQKDALIFPIIMDTKRGLKKSSVLFLSEYCGVFLGESDAYASGKMVDGLKSCYDKGSWRYSKCVFTFKN